MKELAIVVKADVQGSAEAVKAAPGEALQRRGPRPRHPRRRRRHQRVRRRCWPTPPTPSSSASTSAPTTLREGRAPPRTKVDMRMYRVIYDAINDDRPTAMKGMLAPKFREVSLGELQVRQVYKISNVGTVAGCRVTRRQDHRATARCASSVTASSSPRTRSHP